MPKTTMTLDFDRRQNSIKMADESFFLSLPLSFYFIFFLVGWVGK